MTDQLARFAELMARRFEGTWHFKGYDEDTIYATKKGNDWAIVRGAMEYDGPAICAAVNTSDAFVRVAQAAKTAAYAMGGSMGPIIGLKEALSDLEKALAEEMG